MAATAFVWHVIQGSIFLALAPLVIGLLRWTKARLQGRQGPAWFQFYWDLFKLLSKRSVIPAQAAWIFMATPAIVFTCYATLGFLMPIFYLPAGSISPVSDLLLMVYLLGLARLMMGLTGMSAGAPFGGLGSSRELFLYLLAEPTLILIVGTLAIKWQTTDVERIILAHRTAGWFALYTNPALLFLFVALTLVAFIEAGRLPYDNPATHLELTMAGKAIHLEYAGPQLALLEWAEALRLTFLLILLANLVVPWLTGAPDTTLWQNVLLLVLWLAKLGILVIGLALWESAQVKTRLRTVTAIALMPLAITVTATILAIAEVSFK